ncbi:DUF2975 domain-containing protein [Flavobacterium dauae]|uniref:DUF2975 domain-containing protein n=1 Tax=Flavobacterium dauae TaxID=1563479 RepID=UPI00101B2AF5|nr:DUF2975 domain-containing protein [Flavobacterium dauae]WLD22715.1 DUF2975 domain-containing protein [Flavobacterium dauae]
MKTLHLLSLIINILFYSLFGIGILSFALLIFIFLGYELGIQTTFVFSDKNKLPMYLFLLSLFIFYASYVYSLFLFKKNIDSFIKLQLFTNQVIRNFKVMGIIYLAGYLISILSKSILPFYFNDLEGYVGVDYNENSLTNLFDFPLNGLIIGLFFLVLSQVFQIAKFQKEENIELKQENDLTI